MRPRGAPVRPHRAPPLGGNMAKATAPVRISFEDFTTSVSSAILRAIDARKLPRGPILIGIVLWPHDLGPGRVTDIKTIGR